MTRDEEIRQDLARQWQELDGKKTDQDVEMIVQDIRDFLKIDTGFGNRKQPLKQGPSSRSPAPGRDS